MRTYFVNIVMAAAFSVGATAEDAPRKHPIDIKIEAAEEKAMSTAEQTQAQTKGLELWDAEMNRVYAELRKRLKPSAFAALQVAQRDWLKYRDSQKKFLGEMYDQFQGTMYIPMQASAVMQITRARALELTHLLRVYEESAE